MSKPGHTDTSVVFAKTDPAAGAKGISAFIVDKAESSYRSEDKKLVFECNIGEMIFEETRVPKANLLGAEGQGMRIAMTNLDTYRPTVGAFALGMGERALALALDFAKKREMFGQKLIDFQVSQFKLAEMKIMLDAASLLVYRAAWLADNWKEKARWKPRPPNISPPSTRRKSSIRPFSSAAATASRKEPGWKTCTGRSGRPGSTRALRKSSSWSSAGSCCALGSWSMTRGCSAVRTASQKRQVL